ncbi:MAG: hypothetical protein ACLP8S_02045 [Solirubrobacteraceae bacterium]
MRASIVSLAVGTVMTLGLAGCGGSSSSLDRSAAVTSPPASVVSETQPNGAGFAGASATAPRASRTVRSDPVIGLPPGKLVLATLRLRSGAPYFIYGQRIRLQGREYFCLSAGDPNGSFQTCPHWPLNHEPTRLLIGGGPAPVELALAIAPRDETCTFLNLPGGPYHTSRVQLPMPLQVNGEVIYAFLKDTSGSGPDGSVKSETGEQIVFDPAGKARCVQ